MNKKEYKKCLFCDRFHINFKQDKIRKQNKTKNNQWKKEIYNNLDR